MSMEADFRIIADDKDRIGPWVAERIGAEWVPEVSVAIGLEKKGCIVAGVIFDQYIGKSICAHIAGEGMFYNKEFFRVCFDYAFRQAGVNKILGLVGEKNKKALKFDKHLGFVDECVIKDAHKDGDLVVLSMTKAQCRYI